MSTYEERKAKRKLERKERRRRMRIGLVLMVSGLIVGYTAMEKYFFVVDTTEESHEYEFNNAEFGEIYSIPTEMLIIEQNYSDIKDYNGTIYIYYEEGHTEDTGFLSKYKAFDTKLYIIYIESGIANGIVYENNYHADIKYNITDQTINVDTKEKIGSFHWEMLILICIFIGINQFMAMEYILGSRK